MKQNCPRQAVTLLFITKMSKSFYYVIIVLLQHENWLKGSVRKDGEI